MRDCKHEGIGLPWCSMCNPFDSEKHQPPVAPPPASPEPMLRGWTFEEGGWVDPDGNSAELHAGGDLQIGLRVGHYHYFAEFPLPVLRALLATQGLSIVDESSAKVLEAMNAIPQVLLESCHQRALEPTCRAAWAAELEKRNA